MVKIREPGRLEQGAGRFYKLTRRIEIARGTAAVAGVLARGLTPAEASEALRVEHGIVLTPAQVAEQERSLMRKISKIGPAGLERAKVTDPPSPPESTRGLTLSRRAEGFTPADISRELGIPEHVASRYVLEELTRLEATAITSADLLRRMQVVRLESYLRALAPRLRAGDARAIEVALKLDERFARLYGLDAPAKVNLEVRLRDLARTHGLDEDELIQEAFLVLSETRS